MQSRTVLIVICTLTSTFACTAYRRDCTSPLHRTVWVEPGLEKTAKKAALEWYDRTDGWEIIDVKSPITREKPIPGDINIKLRYSRENPLEIAGAYFSHSNTIFIEYPYKDDVSVMMHELGHAMGSPHLGPPGTVMHPNVISTIIDPMTCKHVCCKPKKQFISLQSYP